MFSSSPDVQWLHCIEQFEMEGGENEFVDGYRLLDIIRRQHPDIWKIMTTVPIEWLDTGGKWRYPVHFSL